MNIAIHSQIRHNDTILSKYDADAITLNSFGNDVSVKTRLCYDTCPYYTLVAYINYKQMLSDFAKRVPTTTILTWSSISHYFGMHLTQPEYLHPEGMEFNLSSEAYFPIHLPPPSFFEKFAPFNTVFWPYFYKGLHGHVGSHNRIVQSDTTTIICLMYSSCSEDMLAALFQLTPNAIVFVNHTVRTTFPIVPYIGLDEYIGQGHIRKATGLYNIVYGLGIPAEMRHIPHELSLQQLPGYYDDYAQSVTSKIVVQGFTDITQSLSANVAAEFPQELWQQKELLLAILVAASYNAVENVRIYNPPSELLQLLSFLLSSNCSITSDPNNTIVYIRVNDLLTTLNTKVNTILKTINLRSEDGTMDVLLPAERLPSANVRLPAGVSLPAEMSRDNILQDMFARACTLKKGYNRNIAVALVVSSKNITITSNTNVEMTGNLARMILKGERQAFLRIKPDREDWFKLLHSTYKGYTMTLLPNAKRVHAETHLVSTIRPTPGQWIGISAECCPLCSIFLRSHGYKFYRTKINATASSNWVLPQNVEQNIVPAMLSALDVLHLNIQSAILQPKTTSSTVYYEDPYEEANKVLPGAHQS